MLLLAGVIVFAATAAGVGLAVPQQPSPQVEQPAAEPSPSPPAPAPVCRLKGKLRHVVYLVFDNVHFSRDNPRVPSDLEQMPHLLDFVRSNGTLLTNNHTPLIAHTGGDIVAGLTGLYPDRQGQAVSNSYRYFDSRGRSHVAETFTYWTDRLKGPGDTAYNLVSADGNNAPAPWVPFTRAGCDVGVAGVTGMALESGPMDMQGLAVHCAAGSPFCGGASDSVADRLPDEPGGYGGFRAVFGERNLAGRLGQLVGFPGFGDLTPAVTLGYVAAMQERGVPVTYGYISAAHDRPSGGSYGPGESGYTDRLQSYDAAFAAFFDRLAAGGLDVRNTLFVFTADEGDHFVGGPPNPAACDGVRTPCTYARTGEVGLDLTGLLAQAGSRTGFAVHADSAPAVYIDGNPPPAGATARALERSLAALSVVNPYTDAQEQPEQFMADPIEMKLLHMVTGDPARTPSFVYFMKPDYFGSTGPAGCGAGCVSVQPGSAWNHGSIAADMNTTWLGLAGPGVQNQGVDSGTWADETDIRPTLMYLAGLRDAYRHDGRLLLEALDPRSLGPTRAAYFGLAVAYKRIDAPLGDLALRSLAAAKMALGNPSTSAYETYARRVTAATSTRERLATRMSALLDQAAFDGKKIDPTQATRLVEESNALLGTNL
jgi:hypothetical protein